MNTTACRVTTETNDEYQRINIGDVYLKMVTEQVDAEFLKPFALSLSDAISEIRDHDQESVASEIREQSDLIATGDETMSAWVAGVRQRLIDIRVERGSES